MYAIIGSHCIAVDVFICIVVMTCFQIMLLGNKCDLAGRQVRPSTRDTSHITAAISPTQVQLGEGQDYARRHGMAFCEVSALTGHNVEYAFAEAVHLALNAPSATPASTCWPCVRPHHHDSLDHRAMSLHQRPKESHVEVDHVAAVSEAHTDSVWCTAITDSVLLSGSRDATVRVWDMDTGRCNAVLIGATASCVSATLTPPRTRQPGVQSVRGRQRRVHVLQ